ncbi:hypothetical protein IW261DRAFT_1427284 [Armillaria novae-zelandiae]|uniref:Uncharacterized protein n=1 Tax=Armillaria novae-zelandiae TaxID=153914 RepID=A0AA39NFU5_9AGAR|nr:hypothetical protein IW261DRAFT_1427284 [Armillaria novae-zelandiae]
MFEHRRANYYCEDHSVPHRRPTPRRHFAYRPERMPWFHPLLSAPPRRRAYGPSHRFAHISSPHLSDQDYCRSRVVNPEQTNLGKSTRSRQLEVHHVLFDTSVLVRTEEWSDAGLVGQSDQFQPLKGDEGAGKMYRSRFKMRVRHVDFGANSVYDQLQHDPMRRVVADHHFTAAVPGTMEHFPTDLSGTGPHALFSISKAQLEGYPTPIAVVRGSSSHHHHFM